MHAGSTVLGILYGVTVWLTSCSSARVMSGRTVCHGGPENPCYKIAYFSDVSSRVAFWEAEQVCNVDGGSLVSVESVAEQQHIQQLLQNLSKTSSGPGISDGDFWIGLTRVDSRSTGEYMSYTSCSDLYKWTDGSEMQFRNWYFDEPSCGGEACVVMYHQPTAPAGLGGPYLYQWNDDRCTMKHNFICKYKPDSPLQEHEDSPVSHPAEPEVETKTPDVYEEENLYVTVAGHSSILLIYVIIPTIPLLLLILVASATCCFQMLSKRKPQTKTRVCQSTLWISKTPRSDSAMEV